MRRIGKYLSIICFFYLFESCKISDEKEKDFEVHSVQRDTTLEAYSNADFYLPTSTTGDIVKHNYYTLSYSEAHEQAEWVAYELKKEQLSYTNHRRPYFIEDPEVESGSANWKNYIRSGYDRGHLCPAGDRRFSKAAFNETFYTSNISPQKNDFNAGIWNRLEQKTRYWARKYDGLYVVTGGVLSDDLDVIGKEDVAVPVYFYKILIDKSRGEYKAIAFLMPHEESDKALNNFVVSIDIIEKMTGIDFFPNLPDAIENQLERKADYKGWSF
ncbi:DNA/RNA non-specific endonuclease [Flavobacterium amnicola]|uniref:Endonuclease n=1 Tax=Flavobacterium amnicola TaxID=2506422 RepID=A0A4Q1K6S9_9FLAO|nr:DNA/RNA non-specific endonuclease [Flavobacterium amnicola]RXR21312.1 DNA/RNA non-specific endonuclease [Flavobacterium amnicola]